MRRQIVCSVVIAKQLLTIVSRRPCETVDNEAEPVAFTRAQHSSFTQNDACLQISASTERNDDPCRRFRQVLAGENRPRSPRRR